MALPVAANVSVDIYRNGTGPMDPPALDGVPGFLQPAYDQAAAGQYTHVLLLAPDVDVRDGYRGAGVTPAGFDHVYYPAATGPTETKFNVVFVERVQRGTAQDHKRVYLDRQQPSWPTDDL
jgi:hypothetical protein